MTEDALENEKEGDDQEEEVNLNFLRWPGIKHVLEELDRTPALSDTEFGKECTALAEQYSKRVKQLLIKNGEMWYGDFCHEANQIYYQVAAPVFLHKDAPWEETKDAIDMTLESLDESAFGKFLVKKDVAFAAEDGEPFQINSVDYIEGREEYKKEFRAANPKMDPEEMQAEFDQMDLHCKDTVLLMAQGAARLAYEKQLKYHNGGRMNRASIEYFTQKLQCQLDQLHCKSGGAYEHDMIMMSQTYLDSLKQQLEQEQEFDAANFGKLQQKASRVAAGVVFRRRMTIEEIDKLTQHYVGGLDRSAYAEFLSKQPRLDDDDDIEYYVTHKEELDSKFRTYAKKHNINAGQEIADYEIAAKLLGLLMLNSSTLGYLENHIHTPFGISGEIVAPETPPDHIILKKEIGKLCTKLEALRIEPETEQHAEAVAEANSYLDQWVKHLRGKHALNSTEFDDKNSEFYVKGVCQSIGLKDLTLKSGKPLADEINGRLNDCAQSPYIDFLTRMECIDENQDLLWDVYEDKWKKYEAEFPHSPEAEGINPVHAIRDFKIHLRANELLNMADQLIKTVKDRLQNQEPDAQRSLG